MKAFDLEVLSKYEMGFINGGGDVTVPKTIINPNGSTTIITTTIKDDGTVVVDKVTHKDLGDSVSDYGLKYHSQIFCFFKITTFMMFRILLFISFFCLQSQAAIINQDSLMLSATVIDEVQEPLPYATVMLITEDGEIIKSTTTDQKGVFNLSAVETDGLFVAVRFMGYKQMRIAIPLPAVIQLEPTSNTLQEILVKGKKAVYKVSEGAFEIDVAKSELNKLPEIADVLAFLPGLLSSGGRVVPM